VKSDTAPGELKGAEPELISGKKRGKLGIRQKKDKLIAKVFDRYPSLFNKWVQHSKFIEFSDSPWARLDKDITRCRLAMIATGGVHLKSQPPFDMADPAGDPTFREIPADTSPSDLVITHNYYSHSDADKDVNIVLPIERVFDLKQAGDIGNVNYRHFSFMGHIMDQHIDTLMKETAPRVADELKSDEVDIVI
jgi:D-proline reductase (dithiol) PrdB